MPIRVVVADACSALNLLATDRASDFLHALDWTLILHPEVKQEAQYLRGPPDEEGQPTRLVCDWSALEQAGRVLPPEPADLGASFEDAFVGAAVWLTDVDAKAVALAGALALPLLSDDGKVREVFQRLYPALELQATLELIRRASERLGLSPDRVREVLRTLRSKARFAPPRNDPSRDWYEEHLSND
ncbi:hypothetical protein [Melittangium boletus]|uniref:Uncharacterized protein n=1 Tax=Melittangium boletus DSM 14713 TaxID=1294270 RepID=A0A250IEJ6_9BACT|nr:hypothetical protein [Melittangium boletus]ATB29663.1 hypothetical protein MEBOL_003118 [Melittangium boletus DSM 14713]